MDIKNYNLANSPPDPPKGFIKFSDLDPDVDYPHYYTSKVLWAVTAHSLLTFAIDIFKKTYHLEKFKELDEITYALVNNPSVEIFEKAKLL